MALNRFFVHAAALAFALGALSSRGFSAAPVLENPLVPENAAPRVEASIPVGKTLVLPLLARDADGDVLDFTVQSSNPDVFARVRSGCPILKIHVSYAGAPNQTPTPVPAFEGDLEFQLFRDLTPTTSGIIGGAAQAGFYTGQIFHRVIPGFVIQGGDPAGTGSGDVGFSFEHEFRPELIFSGRGQLAMANSQGGYERGNSVGSGFIQLGDFSATNGSQFFVTIDQPRNLDFKHTIFGQLLRGFDVLDKIVAVPRNASDKPTVDVKMTTVSVTPGTSDATLFLSAKSAGKATLTVTATDPTGGKSVRKIPVLATRDFVNDPPILRPIPNLLTPVGVGPSLPLKGLDLEHDYLLYGIASASGNTSAGSFGMAQIAGNFTPRNSQGAQDLVLGVAGFNDPLRELATTTANPFGAFEAYRWQVAEIGYGDRAIAVTAAAVEGTAGTALSSAVLATFADADAGAAATNYTAMVNWGDGSAEQNSAGTSPPIRIVRSATAPGTFEVNGTHTYARPGVYFVEVMVDGDLGAVGKTRSEVAIVAPGTALRLIGQGVASAQAILKNRVLATFSDTTPGVQADDFAARIDWGDGRASRGLIVEASPGRFSVQGTHRYLDAEDFSVFVHLTRRAPTVATTVAWSRVHLSGFKGPKHLPPFSAAHLVGEMTALPGATLKKTSGNGANSVTRFSVAITIINSGDRASKAGKLKFYLSENRTFNASKIDKPGTVDDSPKDVPLLIGTFEQGDIPALNPGKGVTFNLGIAPDSTGATQDLRLVAPKGNTGSGSYILAHLDYSDPLADQLPITRDVTLGRINGIVVKPRSLTLTEAAGIAHTGTFTVVLDARPDADVTISLTISPTTEASIDKTSVKFTNANWNVPQTVTVTATNDTADDGTKTSNITLGAATSTDPAWAGMSGGTVQVSTLDDDPTP